MLPDQPAPGTFVRKLRIFGVFAALVAVVVVVTGIMSRERGNARLREWTDTQAIPAVATALPDAKTLRPVLNLPGRLEAYSRAPIFARVSGYVKEWKVDIGAPVKAGQLLAEIEAPDLDQQLLQARADLLNAQGAAKLSEATLKRRQALAPSNIVSQQDLDERAADLSSKQAAVQANQANVERLMALASYKKVTAPFDGFVTARDTDVGALINGGGGSGTPMFVISDTRKLRVYLNVPQTFVPLIKVGAKTTISVPEYPDRSFFAALEFSSQSVDIASGTTRMQLIVDNAGGDLLPGGYANVRVDLSRESQPLHIPASALIFNQDGLRVATVGPDSRVLFKKVTIARDLGQDIEIGSGLLPYDRVITTPPDGLADGIQVRVVNAGRGKTVPGPQADKDKEPQSLR
jgi:membrane fusion protein, multidrug efflux system